MSSATRAAQLSAQDEDSLLSLQVGFKVARAGTTKAFSSDSLSGIRFYFFPHFFSPYLPY